MRVPKRTYKNVARKIHWAAREASNRALGRAGEKWCLEFERNRLSKAGRDDLALQIEWVSVDGGDGAGYDILSFELDGTPRRIEVKTTYRGIDAPFLLSPNEVLASEAWGDSFYLYRVFAYGKDAQVYCLQGDLRKHLHLESASYVGYVRATDD